MQISNKKIIEKNDLTFRFLGRKQVKGSSTNRNNSNSNTKNLGFRCFQEIHRAKKDLIFTKKCNEFPIRQKLIFVYGYVPRKRRIYVYVVEIQSVSNQTLCPVDPEKHWKMSNECCDWCSVPRVA